MTRKQKASSQPIGAELLQSTFVVNNTQKIFHTPTVEKLVEEAKSFIKAEKGVEAETLFRKALTLEPQDATVMHNLGWLYCQDGRYTQAQQHFSQALANPQYRERAKTLRAQGLCQVRAGQREEGEQSLLKSYEFDAGNPVTAYNLATLMFQRGEWTGAQFYVRRLNNSELANEESLWLGIKVERRLENRTAVQQLGAQLLKRFPQSRQADAYQRGAFDE